MIDEKKLIAALRARAQYAYKAAAAARDPHTVAIAGFLDSLAWALQKAIVEEDER
jgi:hypothetical protein